MRPLTCRLPALALASAGALLTVAGCGFADLSTKSGGGVGGTDGGAEASSADASEPAVTGAGCGAEQQTGTTLCAATSKCPQIVVDTRTFPGCGFRVRGDVVDLVCACGDAICPMGVFSTCAEAAQLLQSQTEGMVCAQVGEGRCTSASGTSSSSSSSSGGSSGTPGCDKQCLSDCGGGAGCASVCGC